MYKPYNAKIKKLGGLLVFKRKDLLGLRDLTKEEIMCILDTAKSMKVKIDNPLERDDSLKHTSMATLFYENSTRTRLSFELASKYLGATAANIEFSAKYDGAKSAVTVDGVKDRAFVEAMRAEFNIPEQTHSAPVQNKGYFGREQTQLSSPAYFGRQPEQPKQDKGATYFNREGFKDIQNKEYIRTDAKTAYTISQEAQKFGIEHSVKYDGDKSAVTLDGVKSKDFIEAVRKEFNIPETERQEKKPQRAPAYFGKEQARPAQYRSEAPVQRESSYSQPQQNREPTYFNREGFKDIQNKTFIQTDAKTA